MHYTPSTSPPTPWLALLGVAIGGFLAFNGVKAIIQGEFKTGHRRGYKVLTGKEAVYNGLFFVFGGLFFVIFGIIALIKLYPYW